MWKNFPHVSFCGNKKCHFSSVNGVLPLLGTGGSVLVIFMRRLALDPISLPLMSWHSG